MKNAIRVLCLRIKLSNIIKEKQNIQNELDEYKSNNEFLSNENATLKQINKKRYIHQEEKMYFLMKREKKLQKIEQMSKEKKDFREIRKVIDNE